jgi:hypothetical protein
MQRAELLPSARHEQSFDLLELQAGLARLVVELDPRHALVPAGTAHVSAEEPRVRIQSISTVWVKRTTISSTSWSVPMERFPCNCPPLELGGLEPTRYHRIAWDGGKIEAPFVDLFVEAHRRPPEQIILDLDATDDPLHGRHTR